MYLVDFSAYKPPEELRVKRNDVEERGKHWPMYRPEMKPFLEKVFDRSGLSPEGTYLPAAINPMCTMEPKFDMDTAMLEARAVMTGAVEEVMEKAGLKPADIDVVITNCSIYCPTPSLASMLVNHFKFRNDVLTFHLGGMGCGNGVMAMGLIQDILKARPNMNVLFVPAEITTYAFYPGTHKNYTVANLIFRMGGAAIVLSNKSSWAGRAKYALAHTVRVHTGQDDESYKCMSWGPDPDGVNGVYLGKNVVTEAGKALELCMRRIAPKVMTWRQYGEAAANYVSRDVLGQKVAPYRPDFTQGIDHFAIHAGGYAVLKGIQEGLHLPAYKMLPSFAALREYGNTSCSTTWYVMGYMETCEKVNKGQTILQVGMGGGMEAGVNVWRALKNNHCIHKAWEHLKDTPLTEDDLPRSITAIKPDFGPADPAAAAEEAAREKAAQAARPAVAVLASAAAH